MLEVQVERAVDVVDQRITVTDREAVDLITDLETLIVVHGDRPEAAAGGSWSLSKCRGSGRTPSILSPSASAMSSG